MSNLAIGVCTLGSHTRLMWICFKCNVESTSIVLLFCWNSFLHTNCAQMVERLIGPSVGKANQDGSWKSWDRQITLAGINLGFKIFRETTALKMLPNFMSCSNCYNNSLQRLSYPCAHVYMPFNFSSASVHPQHVVHTTGDLFIWIDSASHMPHMVWVWNSHGSTRSDNLIFDFCRVRGYSSSKLQSRRVRLTNCQIFPEIKLKLNIREHFACH